MTVHDLSDTRPLVPLPRNKLILSMTILYLLFASDLWARVGINALLPVLQKDLQEKTPCQIALVEYGGNDCDFDWKAIAADPTGEHKPKTSIESFVKTLETMAENLLQRNIQPLLMTLPPVDASRYLSFICRDGLNRANIIQWLGGGEQMIYR